MKLTKMCTLLLCMVCILTSFGVLLRNESWLKYTLKPVSDFFLISNLFYVLFLSETMKNNVKKCIFSYSFKLVFTQTLVNYIKGQFVSLNAGGHPKGGQLLIKSKFSTKKVRFVCNNTITCA